MKLKNITKSDLCISQDGNTFWFKPDQVVEIPSTVRFDKASFEVVKEAMSLTEDAKSSVNTDEAPKRGRKPKVDEE